VGPQNENYQPGKKKKFTLSLLDKHMESQWDEIVMGVVTGSSISIVFVCFFFLGGLPHFDFNSYNSSI